MTKQIDTGDTFSFTIGNRTFAAVCATYAKTGRYITLDASDCNTGVYRNNDQDTWAYDLAGSTTADAADFIGAQCADVNSEMNIALEKILGAKPEYHYDK